MEAEPKPDDAATGPRETKIQLEQELAEKRAALEELEGLSPKDFNGLKKQGEVAEKLLFEISSLESEIEALGVKIKASDLQERAERRASAEERAKSLIEERVKPYMEGLTEVVRMGQEECKNYQANIVPRRVQTSSSRYIKLERVVKEKQIDGFDIRGNVVLKEFERREEIEVQAVPNRLKEFFAEAWKIVPGQPPIEEEASTPENSTIINQELPVVFQLFQKLAHSLNMMSMGLPVPGLGTFPRK